MILHTRVSSRNLYKRRYNISLYISRTMPLNAQAWMCTFFCWVITMFDRWVVLYMVLYIYCDWSHTGIAKSLLKVRLVCTRANYKIEYFVCVCYFHVSIILNNLIFFSNYLWQIFNSYELNALSYTYILFINV